MIICCRRLHNAWRWHFFIRDCEGCGCSADDHSLILLGHPCLACATCPAYVGLADRPDPTIRRRG